MPREQAPRHLGDLVDKVKTSSGPHLPPGRAYFRAATEGYQAEAPPDAPFSRKLSAFFRNRVFDWVFGYLKFRFGPKHAFQTYAGTGENGIYPLAGDSYFRDATPTDEPIRVGVAGDWATGTPESEEIAERIKDFQPHYTLHIGDVYYAGDRAEVEMNCLGRAPQGSNVRGVEFPTGSIGSFAMNGNHEMYANGNGYFDVFLPVLGMRTAPNAKPAGQKASYVCLRNDYWDVIGVDTGYNSVGMPILEKLPWFQPSCKLPDPIEQWLRDDVKPSASGRAIVLLCHHQNYSAFEDIFQTPARQLAQYINRPVLWMWGHEHRLAVYGKARTDGGIESFGRCLGHGGMPVDIGSAIKHTEYPLVFHDERLYQEVKNVRVGFNGLAQLTFRGRVLEIEYRDLQNNLLLREEWESDGGALRGRNITRGIDDPALRQSRDLSVAIGGASTPSDPIRASGPIAPTAKH
jgi:hypothetical protein